MSLLKLIKAQLGISVTPANNFVLDASADNGTMKLARGNAGATTQDILTVGADGKVTATQGFVGSGAGLTGIPSSLVALSGTPTTSGSTIDLSTALPASVKRITVSFSAVSTNGAAGFMIQMGSGSYETTGYAGNAVTGVAVASAAMGTTGFGVAPAAANSIHGTMILTKVDTTTNTWSCLMNVGTSTGNGFYMVMGSKAFSGAIDRIRIATINNPTDTFDAGMVGVLYEV